MPQMASTLDESRVELTDAEQAAQRSIPDAVESVAVDVDEQAFYDHISYTISTPTLTARGVSAAVESSGPTDAERSGELATDASAEQLIETCKNLS